MEHDDPLERRREKRSRQNRTRLLVLGALVGLVLAGVVVVAVVAARGRDAGDSPHVLPGGPSDDWTHAELAAHLRKRGVPVEVGTGGPDFGGGVYSSFTDPATKQWVSVTLVANLKAAREFVGANPKAFAWGRFVVRPVKDDSQPFADRIRAALN